MPSIRYSLMMLAAVILLAIVGCQGEDTQIAKLSQEAAERQARQSEQTVELQKQVAEGTRRMVEADAKARAEWASLHQDFRQIQAETARQRDLLEQERQKIADHRFRDPIIATALTNVGLMLACLLPLVLGIYVLRGYGNVGQPDIAMTEILVQELTDKTPLLLPSPSHMTALGYQAEPSHGSSELAE